MEATPKLKHDSKEQVSRFLPNVDSDKRVNGERGEVIYSQIACYYTIFRREVAPL
jgi:hypothetical protein